MNSMLEYKGYQAIIEFNAEDKIFVGEVLGIVDSLNFHRSYVDKVEKRFHQSIENYLIFSEKYGKN